MSGPSPLSWRRVGKDVGASELGPDPFPVAYESGLWIDFVGGRWCEGCGRGRDDRLQVMLYFVGNTSAPADRLIEARCSTCTVALLRTLRNEKE